MALVDFANCMLTCWLGPSMFFASWALIWLCRTRGWPCFERTWCTWMSALHRINYWKIALEFCQTWDLNPGLGGCKPLRMPLNHCMCFYYIIVNKYYKRKESINNLNARNFKRTIHALPTQLLLLHSFFSEKIKES